MISNVMKRNGELVEFDKSKIIDAISKACDSVGESDKSFIEGLVNSVVAELEHSKNEDDTVSVETVQDVTEIALMDSKRHQVAKSYILYRDQRAVERAEKHRKLLVKFDNDTLKVTKSDGRKEPFNVGKIKDTFDIAVKGYEKKCSFEDLMDAFKKNIVDEIKTSDMSKLLVKTCVDLTSVENVSWLEVAGRFAVGDLYKKATKNRAMEMKDVYSPESYLKLFKDYVSEGLYFKDFFQYYTEGDILAAGKKLNKKRDESYTYSTVLSLSKRYLLNPNKFVRELPQEMYMSVALFLAIPEPQENRLAFALDVYEQCSSQKISLPTPTLVNARTNWSQLSSCFKINVGDDLRAIYHSIENMAQISKFGGGIGVYLGNVRANGSSIRGIENASGGVNPWIKVINDTAISVNQLGSRLGAISVALDIWHADIYDFLDLQTETGDIRAKSFDIFPQVCVPNLFMERMEANLNWTLFDPHEILTKYGKSLQDCYGKEFEEFYEKCESDDSLKIKKSVTAKELFKKFLKTVVETGMPYVFFRDTVNEANPNKHAGMVYNSNLCQEICQNTSEGRFLKESVNSNGNISLEYVPGETVVCNLASINVAKVHTEKEMKSVFPVMARILDNVITLNFYPIEEARLTAMKYRPVGIGYLGLAEYLATHGMAYEDAKSREHVNELFDKYAYYTYEASMSLAKERGRYPLYEGSDFDKGLVLSKDKEWFLKNSIIPEKWEQLFDEIKVYGVRFGYHTAPAPNTSTSSIVGTTASLLPIYKKYFIETNLSSPTVKVAPKLSQKNFWFYKEYHTMDLNEVIEMIATIYKWVDQSVSFEWMINPATTSPAQLFGYYVNAWKKKIKTVYYVRSMSAEIGEGCVSCSG